MFFKESLGEINGLSCIYKITNTINGKVYIGKTANLQRRLYAHESRIRNRQLVSYPLYGAIQKHGESNFNISILERCDPSKLYERERFHIDNHKSHLSKYGYNVLRQEFDRTGIPHTEETKEKIRAAAKIAAPRGDNHYQRRNPKWDQLKKAWAASRGMKRSPEFCRNLRERQKGIPRYPKTCVKVLQIDKDTDEVIRQWPSLMAATRHFSPSAKNASNINNVVAKRKNQDGVIQKTAYGFRWESVEIVQ